MATSFKSLKNRHYLRSDCLLMRREPGGRSHHALRSRPVLPGGDIRDAEAGLEPKPVEAQIIDRIDFRGQSVMRPPVSVLAAESRTPA